MAQRFEGSLPERFHLSGSIGGNTIQQLRVEAIRGGPDVEAETDARGRVVAFDVVVPGGERIRVLPSGADPEEADTPVLATPKGAFPMTKQDGIWRPAAVCAGCRRCRRRPTSSTLRPHDSVATPRC